MVLLLEQAKTNTAVASDWRALTLFLFLFSQLLRLRNVLLRELFGISLSWKNDSSAYFDRWFVTGSISTRKWEGTFPKTSRCYPNGPVARHAGAVSNGNREIRGGSRADPDADSSVLCLLLHCRQFIVSLRNLPQTLLDWQWGLAWPASGWWMAVQFYLGFICLLQTVASWLFRPVGPHQCIAESVAGWARDLVSYCWSNRQPLRKDHSIAGTTIPQTTKEDADNTHVYW